jgi:hypothetical protein
MAYQTSMLHQISDTLVGAGIIAASVVLSPLMRPWHARWGASASEINRSLPGDDLVPNPKLETTRAITIQAPTDQVWPWLVQIGQGRGGFYSYDMLENLAGCNIHSANHIIPDCQSLSVGDLVRLGPEGYLFYTVAERAPGRWLVLAATDPQTKEPGTNSWVFVLEPQGEQSSRLISRTRTDYDPGFANTLIWRALTDPIQFAMERRMLLGIKERAEALCYIQALTI